MQPAVGASGSLLRLPPPPRRPGRRAAAAAAAELLRRDSSLLLPGPAPPPEEDPPLGPRVGVGRRRFRAEYYLRELAGQHQQLPRDERLLRLAAQVWRRRRLWVGSAGSVDYFPLQDPHTPEVAFIGRRLVGKTSMLRRMLGSNAVKSAEMPTAKCLMNFFHVGESFRLIDTPGAGWTKATQAEQGRWQNAVLALARRRPGLRRVYLFADPRPSGFAQRDTQMLEWLLLHRVAVTLIVSRTDWFLRPGAVHKLAGKSPEDCHQELLLLIDQMKHRLDLPGAAELPVLITSARGCQGVGDLMFDIVAHCASDLPDEDLYIDAFRGRTALARQQERRAPRAAVASGAGGDAAVAAAEGAGDALLLTDQEEGGALQGASAGGITLSPCRFLPPVECPEGFFFEKSFAAGGRLGGRVRPRRDSTEVATMTEAEEAATEGHPLRGTRMLRKYFPALADDYLRRNHADLKPTAKAEAEQYFGMPLPSELREKYLTPDEREARRQQELRRVRAGGAPASAAAA
eukprot:TRINITY_DN51170_c0_g1_i1.p1 TRINITY_DN51170_c0_g1~~TRINITY_DN51170_c0_g1_i1.p1  ORF type:complete len:539 (+),score=143.94 TRINITY_DN51170_c0_g1_i1:70-1617(+)